VSGTTTERRFSGGADDGVVGERSARLFAAHIVEDLHPDPVAHPAAVEAESPQLIVYYDGMWCSRIDTRAAHFHCWRQQRETAQLLSTKVINPHDQQFGTGG